MHPLLAGHRQPVEQRVPHQGVDELVAWVAPCRGGGQQLRSDRLVHRVQHLVLVAADRREQHRKVEAHPDYGRRGQHLRRAAPESFQPSADHEAHTLRHVELLDDEVATPRPRLVEQPVFLDEVLEHLGDEKRISVGLAIDGPDQVRRGGGAS